MTPDVFAREQETAITAVYALLIQKAQERRAAAEAAARDAARDAPETAVNGAGGGQHG